MPTATTLNKSLLITLMLTFFLDFVGLFMVAPIFSPLFLNPHSPMLDAHVSHATRALIIGLLVASYGFGQLIGGPLLGELSDQFGRKKILLIGLGFLVLGNLLGALSLAMSLLSLLFICRLLTGVASGNGAVLFATVSDRSHNDVARGINLGYLTGAAALGCVVAPIIGSRLSDNTWIHWFSWDTPFLFMALVFLGNIFLLLVTFRETATYQRRPLHVLIGFKNILESVQIPTIRWLLLVYFLFVVATESSFVSVPILAVEKFHLNSQHLGNLMAVGALFSAFSSLILNKKLSQRLSSTRIFISCVLMLTIGYLGFFMADTSTQLYIPWSICCFSMVLAWAHANAIIAGKVPSHVQGKILGVTQSLLSMSIILGPLLVSVIATVHYNLAIGVSVVACLLALLVFQLVK